MLRNIRRVVHEHQENNENKDKEDIANRRIHREITKLQESKLIDGKDIYITIGEELYENDDANRTNVWTYKKKYYYILGTFSESYFCNKSLFHTNFCEHIKKAEKENLQKYFEDNDTTFTAEEINKYHQYRDKFCPFYHLFDILDFHTIFDNFLTYLDDINDFGIIFQKFRNAFIIEQDIYRKGKAFNPDKRNTGSFFWDRNESDERISTTTNGKEQKQQDEGRGEKKEKDKEKELKKGMERDDMKKYGEERDLFYTNFFFEILYKDFTNHLSEIHREVKRNLWKCERENEENEENERESFPLCAEFFLFYLEYYSVEENIVFSYYIPDDYPFSKPFISVEHLPVSILNAKSQNRIMGDIYNRRNILELLQSSEWLPITTLEMLMTESKNIVNRLFFYYQYKIYMLYYYLKKHKIFCIFFENSFRITFNCYHFIYSYVFNVNKRLANEKWNYTKYKYLSNFKCSNKSTQWGNENSMLHKIYYYYKQLKKESCSIKGMKQEYIAVIKKKYTFFFSLFSFLFFFVLPILIKSFYIYRSNATNGAVFLFQESFVQKINIPKNSSFFKAFHRTNRDDAFFLILKKIGQQNEYGRKQYFQNMKESDDTDQSSNYLTKKNVPKKKFKTQLKANKIEKKQNGDTLFDVTGTNEKMLFKKLEMNGTTDITRDIEIDSKIEESDKIAPLRMILAVTVSEFILFSLGILYNFRLLRKKNDHFSRFGNMCSCCLLFFNPIVLLNKQKYLNIISIGLLYWSKNFLILKKTYWSALCYFLSIYFNIRNISFFFSYLFIFVYMNSRYVRKIGNRFEWRYQNKCQVLKYVVIYCSLFFLFSYVLFFCVIWGHSDFLVKSTFLTYADFMNDYFYGYFTNVEKSFGASMWNQLHFVTRYINEFFSTFGNGENSNSSNIVNRSIGNNSDAAFFFSAFNLFPFVLIFLFNYAFTINAIMKFYWSLFFSSSLFLLLSTNKTNMLLVYIIMHLLIINRTESFSLVLNITFSSYIIVTNSTFNLFDFIFASFYFLFHIYLSHPVNKCFRNFKYQIHLIQELIKNGALFLITNLVYFYETSIKNALTSFILLLTPLSCDNKSQEKRIEKVMLKMQLQKKTLYCLYFHMNHRYLLSSLSYVAFFLFLALGFSKLYFSFFLFNLLLSVIEFLVFLSILSTLLIFYLNRSKFSKLDFLSIPDSPKKRTFDVERSKKL